MIGLIFLFLYQIIPKTSLLIIFQLSIFSFASFNYYFQLIKFIHIKICIIPDNFII